MPEIKVKHIVSCSSEDNTHKADNLLKADTYRKWKSARPGEKQISVILQFEKSEQIHSVDIGNEGSAFVEVLAGNSTSIKEQDYEVILVTSSFMSPTESRNSNNLNRVRMFGPDKLVKANAEKKWDRVKLICTQPYNKNISYGISFIRFHSPPDGTEDSAASPPKLTKLGQFRVKEEEPNTSSLKPGSLFFNRAAKPDTPPKTTPHSDKPTPSYATATLQSTGCVAPSATPNAEEKPATSTTASPKEPTPGKRKFEFSKERQPPAAKKQNSQNAQNPAENTRPKASPSQAITKKLKAEPVSPSSPPQEKKPRKQEEKRKTKTKGSTETEFSRLLEGTVFVLSGFQNPFRAELRDKALALGAKYRSDWTPDSTHLICAFANTPKYSQVKSLGGAIVRKEWILDCHKRRQSISFKRYLMDGAESSTEESEEDSEEEDSGKRRSSSNKQGWCELQRAGSPSANHKRATPKKEQQRENAERPGTSRAARLGKGQPPPEEGDKFGGSTDEEKPGNGRDSREDSGMDTEDELRRVEAQSHSKKQGSRRSAGEDDPYAGSTDENTDTEEPELDLPIPELPDFLTGKHFFLYGEFPKNERRMLIRYITAFNGIIEEYMDEKVQYVITAQDWDETFEDALMENASLSFVKPRWLYVCNERQKLVPHQPYVVVPQA
ncbi:DNA repair protein XRCC1-like isoform X1 [Acipenser oxyrinchus oxyrinchus]|uniref:DNA repair protein XRCC1 n=1 Tax=Acipenser oxyrinchus oxyrinchus TaxID=40147 RepID=A0AAD8CQD6_ACIOX|nr:DNA repair protein XRCC1-like isoform X1 [Acipenser oxyrinchus oxyrinchus]